MKVVTAALLVVLWSAPTTAQDWPTLTFAAAASADFITTARILNAPPRISADGLSRIEPYEANPLIGWASDTPAVMYPLAISLDVAGVYGWKKLTRNHRKWQAVGLYGAAIFRTFLAVRNTHRLHRLRSSQ